MPKPKSKPVALPEDDVLYSDSEEDEFQSYKPGMAEELASDASDFDEDEEEEERVPVDSEEEDGVGVYEADEWNEDEDASFSEGEDEEEDAAKMKSLRKGLGDIPLDTLRRVQAKLGKVDVAASDDKSAKLAAAKAKLAALQRAKGKAGAVVDEEEEEERQKEAARLGRDNKHAPTAMSTKKQVSRSRQVIDVPKKAGRDPRFSSLSAGQADAFVQSKRYAFVPEVMRAEVRDLKARITAVGKAEKTCKLWEKEKFTIEREGLERQLAQTRTRLERAEREEREREVLASAKREERAKRKEGKGAWYMKESEKRDLLLKAKFESLDQSGGKRAVKKAVEKKRKKVAAKEKKSRPFARGHEVGGDAKRRKV